MTPYQKCVDIFRENRDSFKCDNVVDYFVGLYNYSDNRYIKYRFPVGTMIDGRDVSGIEVEVDIAHLLNDEAIYKLLPHFIKDAGAGNIVAVTDLIHTGDVEGMMVMGPDDNPDYITNKTAMDKIVQPDTLYVFPVFKIAPDGAAANGHWTTVTMKYDVAGNWDVHVYDSLPLPLGIRDKIVENIRRFRPEIGRNITFAEHKPFLQSDARLEMDAAADAVRRERVAMPVGGTCGFFLLSNISRIIKAPSIDAAEEALGFDQVANDSIIESAKSIAVNTVKMRAECAVLGLFAGVPDHELGLKKEYRGAGDAAVALCVGADNLKAQIAGRAGGAVGVPPVYAGVPATLPVLPPVARSVTVAAAMPSVAVAMPIEEYGAPHDETALPLRDIVNRINISDRYSIGSSYDHHDEGSGLLFKFTKNGDGTVTFECENFGFSCQIDNQGNVTNSTIIPEETQMLLQNIAFSSIGIEEVLDEPEIPVFAMPAILGAAPAADIDPIAGMLQAIVNQINGNEHLQHNMPQEHLIDGGLYIKYTKNIDGTVLFKHDTFDFSFVVDNQGNILEPTVLSDDEKQIVGAVAASLTNGIEASDEEVVDFAPPEVPARRMVRGVEAVFDARKENLRNIFSRIENGSAELGTVYTDQDLADTGINLTFQRLDAETLLLTYSGNELIVLRDGSFRGDADILPDMIEVLNGGALDILLSNIASPAEAFHPERPADSVGVRGPRPTHRGAARAGAGDGSMFPSDFLPSGPIEDADLKAIVAMVNRSNLTLDEQSEIEVNGQHVIYRKNSGGTVSFGLNEYQFHVNNDGIVFQSDGPEDGRRETLEEMKTLLIVRARSGEVLPRVATDDVVEDPGISAAAGDSSESSSSRGPRPTHGGVEYVVAGDDAGVAGLFTPAPPSVPIEDADLAAVDLNDIGERLLVICDKILAASAEVGEISGYDAETGLKFSCNQDAGLITIGLMTDGSNNEFNVDFESVLSPGTENDGAITIEDLVNMFEELGAFDGMFAPEAPAVVVAATQASTLATAVAEEIVRP